MTPEEYIQAFRIELREKKKSIRSAAAPAELTLEREAYALAFLCQLFLTLRFSQSIHGTPEVFDETFLTSLNQSSIKEKLTVLSTHFRELSEEYDKRLEKQGRKTEMLQGFLLGAVILSGSFLLSTLFFTGLSFIPTIIAAVIFVGTALAFASWVIHDVILATRRDKMDDALNALKFCKEILDSDTESPPLYPYHELIVDPGKEEIILPSKGRERVTFFNTKDKKDEQGNYWQQTYESALTSAAAQKKLQDDNVGDQHNDTFGIK